MYSLSRMILLFYIIKNKIIKKVTKNTINIKVFKTKLKIEINNKFN